MTNFENQLSNIKSMLVSLCGVDTDGTIRLCEDICKVKKCDGIHCNCIFDGAGDCLEYMREWLEAESEE